MGQADVPPSTRVCAWRALSSALSWTSGSPSVPEIETNGCKLAKEPVLSTRRSARRGVPAVGELGALAPSRRGDPRAHAQRRRGTRWAPRAPGRDDREPAIRPGDTQPRGLGPSVVIDRGEFAWMTEVISSGRLEEWGKTAMSTQRRTAIPGVLREDLRTVAADPPGC